MNELLYQAFDILSEPYLIPNAKEIYIIADNKLELIFSTDEDKLMIGIFNYDSDGIPIQTMETEHHSIPNAEYFLVGDSNGSLIGSKRFKQEERLNVSIGEIVSQIDIKTDGLLITIRDTVSEPVFINF